MYVIKVRQYAAQAVSYYVDEVCLCVVGRGLACYDPGFTNLVHIDSSCYLGP